MDDIKLAMLGSKEAARRADGCGGADSVPRVQRRGREAQGRDGMCND